MVELIQYNADGSGSWSTLIGKLLNDMKIYFAKIYDIDKKGFIYVKILRL